MVTTMPQGVEKSLDKILREYNVVYHDKDRIRGLSCNKIVCDDVVATKLSEGKNYIELGYGYNNPNTVIDYLLNIKFLLKEANLKNNNLKLSESVNLKSGFSLNNDHHYCFEFIGQTPIGDISVTYDFPGNKYPWNLFELKEEYLGYIKRDPNDVNLSFNEWNYLRNIETIKNQGKNLISAINYTPKVDDINFVESVIYEGSKNIWPKDYKYENDPSCASHSISHVDTVMKYGNGHDSFTTWGYFRNEQGKIVNKDGHEWGTPFPNNMNFGESTFLGCESALLPKETIMEGLGLESKAPKGCTCKSSDLFAYGCKCGGS